MKKQYHILNGDALKEQFPEEIEGERIITRECLVDGPVAGNTLDELFTNRAHFLSKNYSGTVAYYNEHVASEFQKIKAIPKNSEIYLWFEDDLFCQVNFWFVANLLFKNTSLDNTIFLVRPPVHTQYGFGGFTQNELASLLEDKIILTEIAEISNLWEYYKNNNITQLTIAAQILKEKYPFIENAVQAHKERIPTKENPGRPTASLISIMKELQTKEFGKVFQEFCKREAIYGYGDLQVKKLYDQIENNSEL